MEYAAIIAAAIAAIAGGVTGGVKMSKADRARRESMHWQKIVDAQARRRRKINEDHFQAQQVSDVNESKQLERENIARTNQLQDEAIGAQKAKQTELDIDVLSQSAGDRANTIRSMQSIRGF